MFKVVASTDSGEAELKEILANEAPVTNYAHPTPPTTYLPVLDEEDERKSKKQEAQTQWAIASNGRLMPVGNTRPALEAGVYTPFLEPGAMGVEKMNINSDGIYPLPDMATQTVLDEITTFWNSEPKYRKHNLLYKRGVLLWGPPGSGKSVTVKLLMQELIKRDGIVIIVNHVGVASEVLKSLRRIEPKRNLIAVFEDIDEIISYSGEANVLSMLDGEHNLDNILNLATTNYIDRLGARIVNRPSRFDRRMRIGMPGEEARRVYLMKATHNGLSNPDLDKWVKDTDEMSIAHLRELVAAVYCLDQSYEEVIERLKAMREIPRAESGFKQRKSGFSGARFLGMEEAYEASNGGY